MRKKRKATSAQSEITAYISLTLTQIKTVLEKTGVDILKDEDGKCIYCGKICQYDCEESQEDIHEDIEVHVEGNCIPYTPATMYARNGDPGDPAEGGYAEDIDAVIQLNGKDVKYSLYDLIGEKEWEKLEDGWNEELMQSAAEAEEAAYEAYLEDEGDRRYEQWRDDNE